MDSQNVDMFFGIDHQRAQHFSIILNSANSSNFIFSFHSQMNYFLFSSCSVFVYEIHCAVSDCDNNE